MSSLDFDLDGKMLGLENEWRQAYQDGIAARMEYESVIAQTKAKSRDLERARERMEQAEALKAQIMAKIERLEDTLLGQD